MEIDPPASLPWRCIPEREIAADRDQRAANTSLVQHGQCLARPPPRHKSPPRAARPVPASPHPPPKPRRQGGLCLPAPPFPSAPAAPRAVREPPPALPPLPPPHERGCPPFGPPPATIE